MVIAKVSIKVRQALHYQRCNMEPEDKKAEEKRKAEEAERQRQEEMLADYNVSDTYTD